MIRSSVFAVSLVYHLFISPGMFGQDGYVPQGINSGISSPNGFLIAEPVCPAWGDNAIGDLACLSELNPWLFQIGNNADCWIGVGVFSSKPSPSSGSLQQGQVIRGKAGTI